MKGKKLFLELYFKLGLGSFCFKEEKGKTNHGRRACVSENLIIF